MGSMQERLTELEVRVAFQEKTIQDLNEVVTRQQQQIERLVAEVTKLRQQITALSPSLVASAAEETPPPHY